MIDMIIKLFLLFFIIMTIKHIYDMKHYNKNSSLVSFDNINELIEGKTILDPLLIKYEMDNDISINILINNNPNKYFTQNKELIRYSDFSNENMYIYKNEELTDEIKSKYISTRIYDKFKLLYSWNDKYFGSIFKGQNKTKIDKNKHNICVIGCIAGKCNIYLYNPKHEDYIHNKNNKKWAISVDLEKNKLLYIPTNWFYNIETTDECILLHIDADTYFTSIYNYYRN
jgi:hypothetical protein